MESKMRTSGTPRPFLSVDRLVKIALLGAIARVVMLLEFPLPMFPAFLALDLSDLVALFGSFALGPFSGVLIVLVKCLLHLLNTSTGGVGDLANFVVGSAFVWSAGMYYQRHKTRSGALFSLGLGTAAMMLSGALVNYFITLPLYALVLGWSEDMIVEMASATIPAIRDKLTLIVFAFTPFNLIKGLVLSVLALPLYKKLSPLLHAGFFSARQR